MRGFLRVLFLVVIVGGLLTVGDERGAGQTPDDILGKLRIGDALDLGCLGNVLRDAGIEAAILQQLSSGAGGWDLRLGPLYHDAAGNRVYLGSLTLGAPFSQPARLSWIYLHDASNGSTPQTPPDRLLWRVAGAPPGALASLDIPDTLAFEFLGFVLEAPPKEVIDALRGADLLRLHLERGPGSQGLEEVALVLSFDGPALSFEITITAEHDGVEFVNIQVLP
ncbi:MAG: hypothetical protein ACE5GW_09885 [Planctomycetota bacterium]